MSSGEPSLVSRVDGAERLALASPSVTRDDPVSGLRAELPDDWIAALEGAGASPRANAPSRV